MELITPESVGLSSPRLDRIREHFDSYVDDGRLPGYLVLVARRNHPAFLSTYGMCNLETSQTVEDDTLFRIYSMTKPITSVALMMLYERGLFQLDDPVSEYLPALKDMTVYIKGAPDDYATEPANTAITIRHLLTHTSGLTYGFLDSHPVDAIYRSKGIETLDANYDIGSFVDRLGDLPLLFSPGTKWNYSVATDVIGRLIEVLSGKRLDTYFNEHILGPLGMKETAFTVSRDLLTRFAACYTCKDDGFYLSDAPETSPYRGSRTFLSGGGGLVSTASDYYAFCKLMLNRGEVNSQRLLGTRTVDYMTSNHLPAGGDLSSMGQPVFSETRFDGIGFGLGFSVTLDPVQAQILGSPGEYAWGGLAGTGFWIDPREELICIFMTQLIPSSSYPLRRELRTLVYQSIID
ncbi:MAG TPA: serine hydrolase [Candidatus Latescibacteria bacterium]|nr:serine hydrolase [Candidatus Latescibacterota bacterium]